MKRTSSELKRLAREHLQGHYGLCIGASVVITLITSALLIPFSMIYELNQNSTNFIIYQLANMIIGLISVILSSGLICIHLKLARKEQPVFSDVFYGFSHRPDRFIICTILVVAISLVCVLPLLLLSFFSKIRVLFWIVFILLLVFTIVAAFIIEFTFALVYPLLVDNDSMTALEALKSSYSLMKGNKGRLFYITLSFLGLELLGLLTCGIGYLWLTPYITQTSIEFYRDVTGESDRTSENTNMEREYNFYSEGVIADFDVTNMPSENDEQI